MNQMLVVAASTTRVASGAASVLIVIYLAVLVVSIIAAVKVLNKAGYSGWWVLITFIPLVNLVMLLVFAFSEWPVVREVKMLRAQLSSRPGYGPPPGYGGGAGFGGGPYPSGPAYPSDVGSGWTVGGVHSSGAPQGDQSGLEPLPPFDTVPRTTAPEQSAQAPPGWYPTPDGQVRYWDGNAWTDRSPS